MKPFRLGPLVTLTDALNAIRRIYDALTEDLASMSVRRLSGPLPLSNVAATRYTVPQNARATINHIHVINPSGGAVNLTVSVGADAAGTRIFDAYPIAAGGVLDHEFDYGLAAGEVLQAYGSVDNTLVMTINGTEESIR